MNRFPRGGNTIFCTQTVPRGDRKGGTFHAGEKPGEQPEKRSEGAQRAEEPEKRPQVSRRPLIAKAARNFPGRSACRKRLFDMLNKFSELYESSENLGFLWCRETGEAPPVADEASLFRGRLPNSGYFVSAVWLEPTVYPFLGYLRAKSRLAAVALRNTPAGVVPHTPFLSIAENFSLYR